MADTMITVVIMVLATSCQAVPYLISPPMSTEIVSGGSAEFTCGIGGRSTETIMWLVNILDTDTYFNIPASSDANPIIVGGFEYDVEYILDGNKEYYRLAVSEVMIPLRFWCLYAIVTRPYEFMFLSDWVSLTLASPASTTSLPSSSTKNAKQITTIILDPTTTLQNNMDIDNVQHNKLNVAAIAGGVGSCIAVIIFLITVIFCVRYRYINKQTNSSPIVPTEAPASAYEDLQHTDSPSSYAQLNERKQPTTDNGDIPTYALPEEIQSSPGEMPIYTYSISQKRQLTPGEMPTGVLPGNTHLPAGNRPINRSVRVIPTNAQHGDTFNRERSPYMEMPTGSCVISDVDSASAEVSTEMDGKQRKSGNVDGLNYADLELAPSDDVYLKGKPAATLYADIKL